MNPATIAVLLGALVKGRRLLESANAQRAENGHELELGIRVAMGDKGDDLCVRETKLLGI